MSSLGDRLRALGVPVVVPNEDNVPRGSPHPIEQVVAGTYVQTAYGPAFVATERHAASRRHGCAALAPGASLGVIAAWAGEPELAGQGIEAVAYIDAETTGLARAAGTYAFLVGVGRYQGSVLEVAQFFMRDPAEEAAMLAALRSFLAPCKVLVTFNGKTFDLPLLRSRYVANKQDVPFAGLPHLDLLSLARRLWRTRLPSRALSCLENEVLGYERPAQDLSGWLIPAIYFDYLRDGDARPVGDVFAHNMVDVLSMAALLSHAATLTADPLSEPVLALDRFDLGSLYEDIGQAETAARLYQRAMEDGLPPHEHRLARRRWSLIEKRRDNLDQAMALWEQAAAEGELYAFVELAKAHEHHGRDYAAASRWTERALDRVGMPDYAAADRQQQVASLTHRLDRLQRKIARGASAGDVR
ncbi:MAG TPA: ribonuclease H-like domain-containing protein [Anaerolineae bacterium]|nr:ribonuclease H-like domain-containing protein [Anaerolineae bacterium]